MEITMSQVEGNPPVTVIHLHGNVDSTTYEAFQQTALDAIQNGTRNLVIDLEHTPYLSSAGLRALNQIYNSLRDENDTRSQVTAGLAQGSYKSQHLKLAAPTKRVMETLKMSGFDMFLEIHPNLEDALNSF